MTDEAKAARRRAVWVAVGYIPALLAVAGPLYLGLRALLGWLLARGGLGLTARLAAQQGLADLAVVPLALVVTWAYLRLAGRSGLAGLGLGVRRGAPWALAAGLALGAGSLAAVLAVDLLAGGSTIRGLNPVAPWLLLANGALATRAGWLEELVCRGVLLQWLERGWGRAAAVAISTAVFVVPHAREAAGHDAVRWLGLVLIGLTLAAAYYAAGRNLWLPIGLHWGFDLWIVALFGTPRQQGGLLRWLRLVPAPNGLTGYVDWLAVIALPVVWLALAAWWLLRRRAGPHQEG